MCNCMTVANSGVKSTALCTLFWGDRALNELNSLAGTKLSLNTSTRTSAHLVELAHEENRKATVNY